MKQKLARFMSGRYGIDELSRALSYVCLALLLLSAFFGNSARGAFLFPAFLGLVYSYFRTFSKDFSKRRMENAKFLHFKSKFFDWFRFRRDIWQQRREYRFFKCPSCRAVLRVPKGKGKIRIVCKKCGAAFEKKS